MSEAPIRHSVEDRYADLRSRMETISDALPELKHHLPDDLYGRICWAVMVVRLPPTQDDIAWAQQVAEDTALDVSRDAARWTPSEETE